MMQARRVRIEGRVQGVGFRWATMSEARRLGLAGWVRNLPAGGVEAFLQGEQAAVSAMIEWLGAGPMGASVRDVTVEPASPESLAPDFEIRA